MICSNAFISTYLILSFHSLVFWKTFTLPIIYCLGFSKRKSKWECTDSYHHSAPNFFIAFNEIVGTVIVIRGFLVSQKVCTLPLTCQPCIASQPTKLKMALRTSCNQIMLVNTLLAAAHPLKKHYSTLKQYCAQY